MCAGVPEHGRARGVDVIIERYPGRLPGVQPGELSCVCSAGAAADPRRRARADRRFWRIALSLACLQSRVGATATFLWCEIIMGVYPLHNLLKRSQGLPRRSKRRGETPMDDNREYSWSWWYLLLLAQFIPTLWVPFYNSVEPSWGGIPFFILNQ